MSIKNKYFVKSIDNYETHDWIINKHYAKRLPTIEYAFGLFDSNKMLQGIVTFGTPMIIPLRKIFSGYKLYELNRLVINENVDKNCLSFLVSNSIKMMPKPSVLVSYADTSQNHHGYIYQATNWIYTGLSAKFKDYYVKGMEHLHASTIYDMSRGKENRIEWMKHKFGDDLIMIQRARKHRYFYFIGNKKDINKMKNILPFEILPYPKGDNKRYDASYKPILQTKLF